MYEKTRATARDKNVPFMLFKTKSLLLIDRINIFYFELWLIAIGLPVMAVEK